MKKKIFLMSVVILSNLGIASNQTMPNIQQLNEKMGLLNASKFITYIDSNKNNKKEEFGRDSYSILNIGSNKFGEEKKNHYRDVIVGTQNVLKNYSLEKEKHTYGIDVFGIENYVTEGLVFGNNNTAVGRTNYVFGEYSKNYGDRSINIGFGTTTEEVDTIAIGFGAKALKTSAISIGGYSEANLLGATSIGDKAITNVKAGVALGYASLANRNGGELGYYPQFDSIDKMEIAKKLGKEKEYKEALEEISKLKEIVDKEKEYAIILNKRDEYTVAITKKTVDLLKYEKKDEKYTKAEEEIKKISEELTKNNAIETEYQKYFSNNSDKRNRLRKAKSKIENIFGRYTSNIGAISVGNEEQGFYRQIIGVAAGSKDTDAVNVSQLKALAEVPVNFYKDGKEIGKLELSKLALDFGEGLNVSEEEKDGKKVMKISLDNKEMKNNMSKLSGSVSNNTAMLNIPNVPSNKLVSIGAGFGYAAKSAAVAVGVSGRDKNNKIIYKASISLSTKGNVNLGAGINYSFGETKDYRDDEIEKLRRDNDELKERLEKLEKILNK